MNESEDRVLLTEVKDGTLKIDDETRSVLFWDSIVKPLRASVEGSSDPKLVVSMLWNTVIRPKCLQTTGLTGKVSEEFDAATKKLQRIEQARNLLGL